MDEATFRNVLLGTVVIVGAVSTAFSVAFVIWTYHDMKARSRDPLAQVAAALMVALLNIFGLIVYVMLRPRETLAEAYERSLEEEALLQEIEEKPACPSCGRPTKDHWLVCPACHAQLRKQCVNCGEILELVWTVCPACATVQEEGAPPLSVREGPAAPSRPAAAPGVSRSPYDVDDLSASPQSTDVQWVDGDY